MAGQPALLPRRRARRTRSASVLLSGTLEPDAWVDIAAALDRKVAAVACHGSQLGDGHDLVADVVRARAAEAAAAAGVPGLALAEGFRRLRLT